MFNQTLYSGNRESDYKLLIKQLDALLEGESNEIASLANASALLNQFLSDINWVGFYLRDEIGQNLVLGPFQGLPACVRIPLGKGVCGTAAKLLELQRVADVTTFPGHIACDAASRSEIVIPLVVGDKLYGVLDVDSPSLDRFDAVDAVFLGKFCAHLVAHLET